MRTSIPYHARQPGPVYFKVLFRVNDFGIVNEAAKEQVHHLFHEGQTIAVDNGKNHGPNCVVSMLHHYLATHDHASELHGHCDNCCGQNKNKTVLAYLCWRVLVGLEDDIKLSFMAVGHTRCSVDGGFGTAKQKFRASDCDTVSQLATVINASAASNKAELCCWEWRDWDTFLADKFKKVVGITKYYHFHFSKTFPGIVKMAKEVDSADVVSLQLLRNPGQQLSADVLPSVLPRAGLSEQRRKYLEEKVAVFTHSENREQFKQLLQ